MKIAVATTKGGLDDTVSPSFGRCQTFTIVETDESKIKDVNVILNQYANATGGAGIQTGGFIANQGVKVAIGSSFGPNAAAVLSQSGVEMVPAPGMKVKEALQKYLNNELSPITQFTGPAFTGAKGKGGGMGMGRGRGMGREVGRGMGIQMLQQPSQQTPSVTTQQIESGEENRVQELEDRLGGLEDQLKEIQEILKKLKKE